MTMVEQVAKAIAEQGGSNWEDCKRAPGRIQYRMYLNMACAAIGAMREITPDPEIGAGSLMTLSDINDLDEVCRELGIQDSHVTPADAVRALNAETERFRAALQTIADWRKVNLQGEYEHGLRDIIRCVTDVADAALSRC